MQYYVSRNLGQSVVHYAGSADRTKWEICRKVFQCHVPALIDSDLSYVAILPAFELCNRLYVWITNMLARVWPVQYRNNLNKTIVSTVQTLLELDILSRLIVYIQKSKFTFQIPP